MEPDGWSEIDALFAEALDLVPEERGLFLDRACRGDAGLRDSVERLLMADERARTFLELPAPMAPMASMAQMPAVPGEEAPAPDLRFGPYRLERLISRGGMGTVYVALRDDGQFERRAALKLLHRGARDPDARARFRAERQILARLEHPSIARLYDGGETARGVPFLVMEYVEGLPLDVYCDRNRLTVDERLALFRRLLDAVSYAHQNLLVHRDIKPSNVLVTAQGEPKLLDFGIAKQLAGSESGEPLTRQRMMTPGYASPEQVRGEAVTTASDVYALGVVLYELLCGRSPYCLRSDLPHELEAAILLQEPDRPSLALDRGEERGPSLERICAARRARPGELRRKLRGDLDTLVLTALRKEPQRRYRSVVELSSDIDRYLGARPISARPDTLLYRGGKFVRRHRAGSALAGTALSLIAVLFGSVLDQRGRAERERDKAREAMAFLVDVFKQADPYERGAENVSARELLDTGARRASQELAGNPEVQAALMEAIGQASLNLGDVERAAPLLEGSLAWRRRIAPGSPELANSLESVAWLRFRQSDYEAAEAFFRESIALRRRLPEKDSPQIAFALNRLGTVLVERYQSTGRERSEEIESLHREALDIYRRVQGPEGIGVADSLFQLARVMKDRGDLAQAESLYRQALRIDIERLGDEHLETAQARRALALTLIAEARLEEAEPLLQSALAAQRKGLPKDHPDTAMTVNDLAMVQFRRGRYREAEALGREALEVARRTLGSTHAHTVVLLSNLGYVLEEAGEPAEAATVLATSLPLMRSAFGERHLYVAQTMGGLARALSALGRHGEALDLAHGSLDMLRGLLEPGHPSFANPLRTLGTVLLNAGRPAEAEPYLRQSLDLLRRTQAPGSFQMARVEGLLKISRHR